MPQKYDDWIGPPPAPFVFSQDRSYFAWTMKDFSNKLLEEAKMPAFTPNWLLFPKPVHVPRLPTANTHCVCFLMCYKFPHSKLRI